jgi:purine-binding chemotaxis protein CheW
VATPVTALAGQLVLFSLGGEDYALPIGSVQEIIRYLEPRSVSSDSPWVRGVISLRGKIVPICDLAARLGKACEHEPAKAKIVILDTEQGTVGIVVDEVDEVRIVGPDAVDAAPGAGSDAIAGIVKLDDRLVVLLDPEAVSADLVPA